MIRIVRTQHPVGQGSFFSEIHNWEGERAHLIYDCGSSSCIDNRHFQFVCLDPNISRNSEPKSIGFLVLSHFHSDHINGFEELINHVSFKRVYLPYLTPTERDVVFIQALLDEPNNGSRSLYYLFNNPSELFDNRETEILSVLPSSNDTPLVVRHSDNITINKSPSGTIRWIMRFYCKKDQVRMDRLWGFLEEMGIKNVSRNYRDLLEWVTKNKIQLQKAYNTAAGIDKKHHNLISLCCYSGPPETIQNPVPRSELSGVSSWPHGYFCPGSFDGGVAPGWLGLGDLPLCDQWDEVQKHYGNLLKNVGFVTAPHHGSRHNHDNRLYQDGPRKIVAFSFGRKNSHHHPSWAAVEDVIEAGGLPFMVTENPRTGCVQTLTGKTHQNQKQGW